MLDTLIITENLIGNNVDIPKAIYEKHLKDDFNTHDLINAFNEYATEDYEWKGVKDSTQYLYSLMEGGDALINHQIYDTYKDVEATVKSAISFIESDKNWSFFAFRGSTTKSPKWLLIDEQNKGYTDFSEITKKLKEYLAKDNIIQRKWSEVDTSTQMKIIIQKLRRQERNLLPWKKKRALEKGESILKKYHEKIFKSTEDKFKCEKLIALFDTKIDVDEYVDLDHLATLWLTILIPELDKLKSIQMRRRKIYTLKDLDYKNVNITSERLDWLLESCQYSNTLDELVSACIIAIKV